MNYWGGTLKIDRVRIQGIKSHLNTKFIVENYNTLVGENNSGKSNIIFALRWFFKHENVKISKEDINKGFKGDPSVIIEFSFEDDETIPSAFIGEYASEDDNKFIVEAYCNYNAVLDKPQNPKYRLRKIWTKERDITTFPKIVDIIYVPSIRELSDEIKNTQNSTINKLISEHVIACILENDVERIGFKNVEDSIKDLSDVGEGESSAFNNLKNSLAEQMLDYGNFEINFELKPPKITDLIKDSFKPYVEIRGKKSEIGTQGMGFQRSLIYSLLCNKAEVESSPNNLLKLYLIEEPELFLHPNHQGHFKNKLIDISNQSNNQIIITSHSPYFLNNIENYSQLKRISLLNYFSILKEVKHAEIDKLCDKNGLLMANAFNHDGRMNNREFNRLASRIAKEDELRYLLWIDPNRANAFLSKKVILVEGSTDKALFSFILENPSGNFYSDKRKSEITVVDTVGKYHFYKFANLLYKLGIPTWIMHDGDNDDIKKGISHLILNQYIEEMKEKDIIINFLRLDPDLEQFLNLDKDDIKPDISIYQKLKDNENNCRNLPNYRIILDFIDEVLSY